VSRVLCERLGLSAGDRLGGLYRLESVLRDRAATVTFAATDLTRGTRVMAQVLASRPNVVALDPDKTLAADAARSWFLAGARRAKVLESPHVARVLDAGVTPDGHAWIAREHLATPTLAAHVRTSGPIPVADAVDVALAVCDAIAEAHARGLLHGSLGPHAVHVGWSASGLADVKVVGAGTAAAEKALGAQDECILHAPEQLQERPSADPRSDVWAVGVLLYTMIAGRPPFKSDTPSGASLSVILDTPPPLSGAPRALAELIERAMSKSIEARPASILELAAALTVYATSPDFARDRISARRPAAPPAPAARKSDPEPIPPRPVRRRREEPTVLVRTRTSSSALIRGCGALTAIAVAILIVLLFLPRTRSATASTMPPRVTSPASKSPTRLALIVETVSPAVTANEQPPAPPAPKARRGRRPKTDDEN
jgi:serine/threonine protein kinase